MVNFWNILGESSETFKKSLDKYPVNVHEIYLAFLKKNFREPLQGPCKIPRRISKGSFEVIFRKSHAYISIGQGNLAEIFEVNSGWVLWEISWEIIEGTLQNFFCRTVRDIANLARSSQKNLRRNLLEP